MFLEERIARIEKRLALLEAGGASPACFVSLPDTLARIVNYVAALHELPVAKVFSRTRTARLCCFRFEAIWVAHRTTQLSRSELGRYFKRDHSTILNAIRAVEARRDTEPDYKRRTDQFLAEFQTSK